MKKVLTIAAVSTGLLLGGAAAASAIELDGYIQTRGFSRQVSTASADPAAATGYDQKAAIGVKAKLGDTVTGYLRLETGDGSGDTYGWGSGNADSGSLGLNSGGVKDEDSEMELQQAWIDYKPSWWGVKVGHQPLALGEKLFFDHIASGDDAINLYGDLAGTQFNVITIKLAENAGADNSDDLDAYVLNLSRKFGDNFSGNVNYTLLKGGSDNDTANVGGTSAVLPGFDMSNLGLVANMKFGGIDITADFEKQFGDVSATMDANGYAFLLSGSTKLGGTTVGLLYGMGSGDDDATDNDNDVFTTFLTDKPYQVYIPGYLVQVPGSSSFRGGLSNLTVYQINAKTAMTCPLTGKPLSIFGSLSYLQTSEDVATVNGLEDDLGTEIDLVAAWKLTSNLTYKVEAAYLSSGDAWDQTINDVDNMYFLRHGISLKF